MRHLNKQDLHDILVGCTILGTGGGGSLEKGIELIDKDLEKGFKFTLVSLEEVPDDALIASPYQAGSISPLSKKDLEKYAHLKVVDEMPSLTAFKALEEFLGRTFFATITTELGGHNTAVGMSVAAKLGIPIIDGDPAGRSVPELQHSTFYINDVPITPLAVANKFGDVAVIKNTADDFRAEAVVRAIAVVSQNSVGVADHPVEGRKLKKAVIPGAITYAGRIGKALREAKEKGENPAESVARAGDGYVLFKGKIRDFDWADSDGFTVGNTFIDGEGEFYGNEYKIWYKNENIISWKNGVIHVTVPDLICILESKSGRPITNPNFEKGMEVTVVGLPAPKEWRTPKGLQTFGPRHFGYNVEYIPIENIIG
jgi:hypothetical protein